MPTDADLAIGSLLFVIFLVGAVLFWLAALVYVYVRDWLKPPK
jgi:hypothetical protein